MKYKINYLMHALLAIILLSFAVYKYDGEHAFGLYVNIFFCMPMLAISAWNIENKMRQEDFMKKFRAEQKVRNEHLKSLFK